MDVPTTTTGGPGANEVVAIYLTFPNETSALDLARALVERRLVACVNVVADITSVYRWEGEVVRERESLAIAKTTRERVPAVTEAVQELHPYEVPCVVAYGSVGGLETYLAWVRGESSQAG